MLPPEFEGLYALYEGRYWAIHNAEGDFVYCSQYQLRRCEWIHISELDLQYARKTR